MCQCRIDKNNKRRLESSGLLSTIEEAGFDKYTAYNDRTKKIKKMAMEFIKQKEKPFFYIGGEVGRGKTFICTAICKDYLNNYKRVYYKICSELLRELKSNVNDDVEYYRIFNKYSLVEVLYIDDLFKSRNKRPPTDADVTHMFELINNRYINNRITLFSSELSINDVMYIDEGLGSRIYEKSKGFNFSTDGLKNFRLE